MRMRDELQGLVEDYELAHLFPKQGQPAERPWRLSLVKIFQFVEDLSDRQAADAVRGRIAGWYRAVPSDCCWTYSWERFRQRGLLKPKGRQRTDSSHVLAAVRALNRIELVREALRHTLEVLAITVPDWLQAHARAEWVERHAVRSDEWRLPKGKPEQDELVNTIGNDGHMLLAAVYSADAAEWLRAVPAVEVLRRVWVQNYLTTESGVRWRTAEDGLPKASQFVSSPLDLDAHLGRRTRRAGLATKSI